MRTAASKVMWVGRATVFLVGLAVILAVVLGLATAALAGTGVGDTFNLGQLNTVNQISRLVGSTDNAMLRVDNDSAGANATALALQVEPGHAPMRVNSSTAVANLNADQLDGQHASEFAQANTNSFLRNNTYRNESALGPGQMLSDGTFRIDASCLPGDVMLSGGPANIRFSSDLLESFPANTSTWATRINKNGSTDDFSTVVLCANQ